VTADSAEEFLQSELEELQAVRQNFKNPHDIAGQVAALLEENKALQKKIEHMHATEVAGMKNSLKNKFTPIDGVNFLSEIIPAEDTKALKNLIFQLEKEVGNAFIVFGAEAGHKPQLMVAISENLVQEKGWNAGTIVRELATYIDGGGGGQPSFATAGGKKVEGLSAAISAAKKYLTTG